MGGTKVTKISNRLKPSKVEHLVVSTENKTKVEEFLRSSSYRLSEEDNGFETVTLGFGLALVEEGEGGGSIVF